MNRPKPTRKRKSNKHRKLKAFFGGLRIALDIIGFCTVMLVLLSCIFSIKFYHTTGKPIEFMTSVETVINFWNPNPPPRVLSIREELTL